MDPIVTMFNYMVCIGIDLNEVDKTSFSVKEVLTGREAEQCSAFYYQFTKPEFIASEKEIVLMTEQVIIIIIATNKS